jgi:molybdate transport system ATP-binding protein
MNGRGFDGLQVEGLRVTLGAFTLEADLRIAAGEVVALVGPNGAGKTTLLRTLAGLQPPVAGRVTLGERVLDDPSAGVRLPPQRRAVAVVFQDVRLFPRLDARANVAFGLRARGVPRGEARRRAEEHLGQVHASALAGRRAGGLSGGEAQRVGLARALATDPSLLLLDEPLAAVDLSARDALREVLRERLAALGRPALIVTHDPADALALAGRLVVLDEGRIVQDATAEDVRKDPGSPWIARMLRD